jgi:hypothetical protein
MGNVFIKSVFTNSLIRLIFDEEIKVNLLDYVSTTMLFSDKHVDHNVISWNRYF